MERFFFSFFPVLLYIDRNIRKTKIKKVNFTNTFYCFQVIVFKLMVHIFDKLAFSDFLQKNLKLLIINSYRIMHHSFYKQNDVKQGYN